MSRLYLFNFNNYYNRIITRFQTLAEYGDPIYSLNETNFNYNDGVETSHVISYDGQDGDYIIITNEKDEIQTRWFVLENVRTRGGQHRVSLRRDLIADFYDTITQSPMIIKRAMINEIDNALLFNPEGLSFNEIKTNEILLKDKLGIPFYFLYFNKNLGGSPRTFNNESFNVDASNYDIVSGENLSTWGGSKTFNNIVEITPVINYQNRTPIYVELPLDSTYDTITTYFRANNNMEFEFKGHQIEDASIIWFDNDNSIVQPAIYNILNGHYQEFYDRIVLDRNIQNVTPSTTYNEYKSWNNKLIKDSQGNIYRAIITENRTYYYEYPNESTSYISHMRGYLDEDVYPELERTGSWGGKSIGYAFDMYSIQIILELQTTTSKHVTMNPAKAETKGDFNVVAIPADDVYVKNSDGTGPFLMKKEVCEALLQTFLLAYPSEILYDVQFMPYCPVQSCINVNNQIDPTLITSATYDIVNGESIVLYVKNPNISFNLDIPITLEENPIEYKVNNECFKYRLVSPNYNGQFEFSLAKNHGIDYFNVDITLKPISPYIHVNPNFKGLYGEDFDDARGLICQGDFSIPKITDQFVEFEYRNRNYQNVFERQIQNLDFNQEQERFRAGFSAIVGTIIGGAGGAVAGAKVSGGNPIGMAIGAGAGLIGSAVGGAIDYSMLTAQQNEQKSLQIDMFNYQLGNVKALGYNVSKITPLSYNNKKFPFVEVYSASEKEIEIFKNMIKYKSMNVNCIDYMINYIKEDKTFISGVIIRNEMIKIATHELNEISIELEKGVYI